MKACADALTAATQDTRAFEQSACYYVALLDQWDVANVSFGAANDAPLNVIYARGDQVRSTR